MVTAKKWGEATKAAEAFLGKYKEMSPRSPEVHFLAAIAYLNQDRMQDDAVRELKIILALPATKVGPEAKEAAALMIAKAYTIKGSKLPAETEPQRKVRNDVFGEGIKAFDAYLAAYPKARGAEAAYFLSGMLTLEAKQYTEARRRFGMVFSGYPQSPLRGDAVLNVGKAFLIEAGELISPGADGKEPTPENVEKGLTIYKENAIKTLGAVFNVSTDLAILNETQFYIGQIRLTQSQHVDEPDPDKSKKLRDELLYSALEAFRAVRSVEEVVATQEAKIKALEDVQARLNPLDVNNFKPMRDYYQNLIDLAVEKRDNLKTSTDLFLSARIAIARIFLILEKDDECRVLIRYLQEQKDLFTKDPKEGKDQLASLAALLTQTYTRQGNLEKAMEGWKDFRASYKGNPEGQVIPLWVSNLAATRGKLAEAEQIIAEAREDYKPWPQENSATGVQIKLALERGEFEKALGLVAKVLENAPKPEVEEEMVFIKGSILERMAQAQSKPELLDQAMAAFQLVRDKYPTGAKAEDSWFRQTQILAGKDPVKAITEITKFLGALAGGGKSESTKANVAANQYTLAKMYAGTNQLDKAIVEFRKTIETYPTEEVAPDAFFQINKIELDRKNYPAVLKINQEFIEKYPTHKNVYFAYYNQAELLANGTAEKTAGKAPAPGTEPNPAAGAKKLMDYVDYELEKKVEPPRGESALLKAADIWLKQVPGGAFDLMPAPKRATWQQSMDGVLAAVEKQLKSYPQGERLPEALEKAVRVQAEMIKARQTDAAKAEAYFRDLIAKYGTNNEAKSKILMALASSISDVDAKRAGTIRGEAAALMEKPASKSIETNGKKEEVVVPSFTSADWDKRLGDLFDDKKYDEMTKTIARVRAEYPLEGQGASTAPAHLIPDGQAVALFWEAKILEAQGKTQDAGGKFAELGKLYPKTTKKLEADYGVVNGKYVGNQLKAEKDQREALTLLKPIIGITTGKTFDLQANALLLTGKILEDMGDYDGAVASYAKIADRFGGVKTAAADGLWRAAVILDQQATKKIPVKLPAERAAAAKKAAEAEAAAKKLEEAQKPAPAPAPAGTPDNTKPKATDKTTAAADAK